MKKKNSKKQEKRCFECIHLYTKRCPFYPEPPQAWIWDKTYCDNFKSLNDDEFKVGGTI